MAEPLKYMYSPSFFESLLPLMRENLVSFDEKAFLFSVFDDTWPELELKQRIKKIAVALWTCLPPDFPSATAQLVQLTKALRLKEKRGQLFELMFLPEFIGTFGVNYLTESLSALEEMTKLASGEFAIRTFLNAYPGETMDQMIEWARHPDPNVRRLASEGCRTRLPWASGVPWLKQHPEQIITLLEILKNDSSEYVRRSVANNLNDIGKDHPDLVLAVVSRWAVENPCTIALIRHACRGLIKKGNKAVLKLHGLDSSVRAQIRAFKIYNDNVNIGNKLAFSFHVVSKEQTEKKFRIEYQIDYRTKSGRTSMKVFKLKEGSFAPGEEILIHKNQSFQDYTTRKHFPGKHMLHLRINGRKVVSREFYVC
jgi:3-methyladenine DNA glycosylase AlkC